MKKIIATFCLLLLGLQSLAEQCPIEEVVIGEEHLFPYNNAPCNKVTVTNLRNIICEGNVIEICFQCKFWSEQHKAGDRINFIANEAIYTREGTLLIPANSRLVATITKIDKPRMFNKNARVYLNFECLVFPDNTAIAMSAKPFTKDGALKEGAWMTTGKLAASTVGLGVVGAGTGVGFAFIPNPAKIGTGLAIGIPIGCTVGLITGLITPGLKYHAKAGEIIKIILCEDLYLNKCN